MSAEPVETRGLTMSFGTTRVLRGVDLTVAAGSLVALIGPSGCGKTTLLRCVAGLERPDGGTVRVGTRTLAGGGVFVPAEKRRIGMVFQDAAVFPHLSVARNVAYGLGRRDAGRAERVAQTLALVGLEGFGERAPATLSGGQLQRVALARALAPRPSVILLDEPFSSLDAPLRAELRADVRRLLAAIDATGVFVTHDREEAFVVGDEIAVMDEGVVAHQGSPASLYELPATRAVAEFIGDADFVPGTGIGAAAQTAIGRIPLHERAEGPVDVMIRPERIRVAAGDLATVDRIEYFGRDAIVHLRLDGGATLRSRAAGSPRHAAGDRVGVEFVGSPTVAYPTAA
jgi:iron(III) transport system ATP-binding protein